MYAGFRDAVLGQLFAEGLGIQKLERSLVCSVYRGDHVRNHQPVLIEFGHVGNSRFAIRDIAIRFRPTKLRSTEKLFGELALGILEHSPVRLNQL